MLHQYTKAIDAMLKTFRLEPVKIDRSLYLPPVLLPLVEAAEAGLDLVRPLLKIVNAFGFDSLMYAIANFHLRPDNQERMYVFTTLPLEWVTRYDQRAYVECDPRVLYSFESALPLVWDQRSERGRNQKTDQFLDDALAHGVGSGVAFSIHCGFSARVLVALNSVAPTISEERRAAISSSLGEMIVFGQYFHEVFVRGVVQKGLAPLSQGAPLSPRERQCLQLAANGMTSIDIGFKLGIAERTANFHFSNIVSKLGVLNRREAVAKAVAKGIIRAG